MSVDTRRWQWLAALREPERTLTWDLPEWERVIRLARRLRLVARLAESVDAAGLMPRVPSHPARLLLAEQRNSHHRITVMSWAATRIGSVLAELDEPLVLLKGCAYLAQGLPIANGRLPSDLDMLVPKAGLARVQAALVQAGWHEVDLDEHDRRYYTDWSHETPPMRHEVHPIELDLHHDILPPVAQTHVDVGLMVDRRRPSIWAHWNVFAPVDQVLHSAAHLFLDAEPVERIRDLVDIDGLLRHFGPSEPGFWTALPQRAAELGLAEPLALACHFCIHWLGTPMPVDVENAVKAQGPGPLRRRWLVPLFDAVLTPTEPDATVPRRQAFGARVVLARYHRHRMPLAILLPHLWHKLRKPNMAAEDASP